ncbi:MAG: hypothetical protein GXO66_01510 [Euryarchaeota archaeon]|nr:hypothetical protein [Euryarchaeota archaeon]
MDLITLGAGVAGLFLASVAIVFLSSWILGRSRGGGYSSPGSYRHPREEYSELSEPAPVRRDTRAPVEETAESGTNNSLIQEILSIELPDDVPQGSISGAAGAPGQEKEEKLRDPLVSLIEEFDLTGEEEPEEAGLPEEDPLEELLGGDGEADAAAQVEEKLERRHYSSYPECFGNERGCTRSCDFSEECRRTVEILGEFI